MQSNLQAQVAEHDGRQRPQNALGIERATVIRLIAAARRTAIDVVVGENRAVNIASGAPNAAMVA